METYRKERYREQLSRELTQISHSASFCTAHSPSAYISYLYSYFVKGCIIASEGSVYFGCCLRAEASALHTWAAVRCQVAVAVAVACSAAVDAAVVVVGAGVGPCVRQPGLSGRFPNVEQTRPEEGKTEGTKWLTTVRE